MPTNIEPVGQWPERPATDTFYAVYSNADHQLIPAVVNKLTKDRSVFSMHAAYNFCGYIWFDGQLWHEDVWVYHKLTAHYTAGTINELIERVNSVHGSD